MEHKSERVNTRITHNKKVLLEHLKKTPILQFAVEKSGVSRATVYRWRSEDKAFAVAISPIAPPEDENSINLLPPEVQKKYDRERERIFYRNLFGRSGIVVGVFLLFSILVFTFLTFERQRLEARVTAITDITSSQKPDTQKLLLLNAQAKNIVELAPRRKTARDKLQVIANLLTPTVHITQWEFDDTKQQFILQGEAESRIDLLDFKSRLDASDEFDRITLPLDSLELARNSRFSISFLVKE